MGKLSLVFLLFGLTLLGQPGTYNLATIAGGQSPNYSNGSGDGGSASAAVLGYPTSDISVDGGGNLYILAGSVIRKVSLAGTITTVAGGGAQLGDYVTAPNALLAPLAIAVDRTGVIYFADTAYGISRIRKVDSSRGACHG